MNHFTVLFFGTIPRTTNHFTQRDQPSGDAHAEGLLPVAKLGLLAGLMAIASCWLTSLPAVADAPLFDVAVGKPTAAPGDYVLCPSRQFYDAAVSKGVDKTTFIYYAAKMLEPGEQESMVQNLPGSKFSLPNNLIISIPRGQQAKVGDIVISWWQSGSGMQRCIVVGGTPTQPTVRYLDISYENPSGAGQKEDTLKPDSFYVLDQPWMVGSTVTANSGRQERYGLLLAQSEKKILVREFAGKLKVYDRSVANPLPIRPLLSANDAAEAALFGSMKPVTVVKIDPIIGRVFSTYQLGRTEKEKAFAFGEIRPAR